MREYTYTINRIINNKTNDKIARPNYKIQISQFTIK